MSDEQIVTEIDEAPTGTADGPPLSGVPELGEPDASTRNRWVTIAAWGVTALCLAGIVTLVVVLASREAAPLQKLSMKLANVEVQTVEGTRYDETLILPARLVADQQASVSAELSGLLAEWLVAEGAQVEAGQPVARLERTTLDASLAELQAQARSMQAAIASAEQRLELAKIAVRHGEHDLASSRVTLKGAEADLALAAREHERVRRLAEANVQTEVELDAAQNRLVRAELAVEQAREGIRRAETAIRATQIAVTEAETAVAEQQAKLEETKSRIASLQVTLSKTTLLAPITGRLEKHLAKPGEVVNASQILARLYDLRYVRAQVDVADRFVPFLDRGATVVDEFINYSMPGATRKIEAKVILPGLPRLTGGNHPGLEFAAEVYLVAQASDRDSNTFRVELRMENPGGALKQGIIGQARITYLTYSDAIVIPMRAVQVSDRGPRVLTVERQADTGVWQAQARDIVPLSIQDDRLLITGGLAVGDRLIVAGGKGLVDGEQVQVIISDGKVVSDSAEVQEVPPAGADVALPGKPSVDGKGEVEL